MNTTTRVECSNKHAKVVMKDGVIESILIHAKVKGLNGIAPGEKNCAQFANVRELEEAIRDYTEAADWIRTQFSEQLSRMSEITKVGHDH